MESTSKKIRVNDFSPIMSEGRQTEFQAIKEFSFLFDHVLNGYGVPFQLRKFVWKILILSKPGQVYALNDYQIAEQLGGTTRNYVCNLRRKYKEFCNGENEIGVRNFSFISITENTFDVKKKQQKPTEYCFSKAFFEMLQELTKKVREHRRYRDNWIVAIREVCDHEKDRRLLDFGYWTLRPKKRPRTPDDILGTLLLNWKRTTTKLIEFSVNCGFDGTKTAQLLAQILPQYISESLSETMATGPSVAVKDAAGNIDKFIPVRGTVPELIAIFERAKMYVLKREEVPEMSIPQSYKLKLDGGFNENEIWNLNGWTGEGPGRNANGGGSASSQGSPAHKVLEYRPDVDIGEGAKPLSTMDSERLRFVEKLKIRNRQ